MNAFKSNLSKIKSYILINRVSFITKDIRTSISKRYTNIIPKYENLKIFKKLNGHCLFINEQINNPTHKLVQQKVMTRNLDLLQTDNYIITKR